MVNRIRLEIHGIVVEVESSELTYDILEDRTKELLIFLKDNNISTKPDLRDTI